MNLKLLIQKNTKSICMFFAIILLAIETSVIIPNILTISLSVWMRAAISIIPCIVLVAVTALWQTSGYKLHLNDVFSLFSFDSFSPKYLFVILPSAIILGFLVLVSSQFPTPQIAGQIILFGSLILFLVLGLRKPELGPVAFILLFPFLMFADARLFGWEWIGNMNLEIPEWLSATLFSFFNFDIVLLVFSGALLMSNFINRRKLSGAMINLPIVFFLLWVGISVFTAKEPLEGVRAFMVKWIFPLGLFYATVSAVQEEKAIRKIAIAFIFLLIVSSLFTIQNAALENKILNMGEVERSKVWAVIGGQISPWVVMIMPISFWFLFNRKELIWVRLLAGMGILIGLTMALWEMQRAVWLSFLVMLIMVLILYRRRFRKLVLYSILAAGLIIFWQHIISLIEYLRPGLTQLNPLSLVANRDREILLKEGWDIIKNNPYFGIGPGGFKLLKIGLFGPEVSSHNIFIEIGLESGVAASILFLIIIAVPIVKALLIQTKKHFPFDIRPWVISLLGFFAFDMTSTCWEWGYGPAVFIILGMLTGIVKNNYQSKRIFSINENS